MTVGYIIPQVLKYSRRRRNHIKVLFILTASLLSFTYIYFFRVG
ncbi:hypothetical protein SiRe_0851 [Sulfolobus islandicus REY15A]|uniref:Uncharacterized protein n=1 Tax=Saccharolobus islandicus (strain REY15A) TaxID=930945 RepID=F0NDZ0_SACI5|nr:hypothetical protein SiRe_0851 [Sulfolobus islandicus REY15A]